MVQKSRCERTNKSTCPIQDFAVSAHATDKFYCIGVEEYRLYKLTDSLTLVIMGGMQMVHCNR